MPDDLMTKKDVAKYMSVDTRTVERWVARGRLRALRISNTVRFRRSELIQAMETYQYGDPSPKPDPSMG